MARVVCVHGVGRQQLGERQLAQEWVPALLDGLTRAEQPHPDPDDIAMAFYGDLFLPPGGTPSAGDECYTATDIEDGFESELLLAWWVAAAQVEPQVIAPSATGTLNRTPAVVQAALLALSRSRFFTGLAERVLIADLKQVRRYLTDPALRAAACERVRALIGPDTSVVVAHSLGSLIAYEALCALPGHQVRALITLGSPLGVRHLVFEQLRPAPVDGTGAWPGPTRATHPAWTNLADTRDVMALVKDLRPSFGPEVNCHLVPNGSHAHTPKHYLAKREVGEAIATALA
ncbi:hypothetical protein [Embleya sp. NBC_00896]|uniref:hypothetical protein n=1 Tax=Embleya sp. NBC_00896 TaxID=2975961 RepID=UPI002F9105F4|nr:hypothetical protein OG928_40105 [Embleya sp. NBC_00896]